MGRGIADTAVHARVRCRAAAVGADARVTVLTTGAALVPVAVAAASDTVARASLAAVVGLWPTATDALRIRSAVELGWAIHVVVAGVCRPAHPRLLVADAVRPARAHHDAAAAFAEPVLGAVGPRATLRVRLAAHGIGHLGHAGVVRAGLPLRTDPAVAAALGREGIAEVRDPVARPARALRAIDAGAGCFALTPFAEAAFATRGVVFAEVNPAAAVPTHQGRGALEVRAAEDVGPDASTLDAVTPRRAVGINLAGRGRGLPAVLAAGAGTQAQTGSQEGHEEQACPESIEG